MSVFTLVYLPPAWLPGTVHPVSTHACTATTRHKTDEKREKRGEEDEDMQRCSLLCSLPSSILPLSSYAAFAAACDAIFLCFSLLFSVFLSHFSLNFLCFSLVFLWFSSSFSVPLCFPLLFSAFLSPFLCFSLHMLLFSAF